MVKFITRKDLKVRFHALRVSFLPFNIEHSASKKILEGRVLRFVEK